PLLATSPFFFMSPLSSIPPPLPYISPLSLHDALPIYIDILPPLQYAGAAWTVATPYYNPDFWVNRLPYQSSASRQIYRRLKRVLDRKSTRLNSSHVKISYAVFCLKNKTLLEKSDMLKQ